MTRINQKLIRNPEGVFVETVTKINDNLMSLQNKIMRQMDINKNKDYHRNDLMMTEDMMHSSKFMGNNFIGIQISLSYFKDDFPWIYDAGKEVLEILKSKSNKQDKYDAIKEFDNLLQFSFEHPMMRESYLRNKDKKIMYRELPRLLMRNLEIALEYKDKR